MLGGFHTSANTLHFILILLAMHPSIQRTLQASIDELFSTRKPSKWSHTQDFPTLLNSHVGAVVAETLRCFGVLPWIPKTTGSMPAPLTVDRSGGGSMQVMIPPHTLVLANTSAVHRHPDHWPTISSCLDGESEPFAASSWDPWRWLKNAGDTRPDLSGTTDYEDGQPSLSTFAGTCLPGSYVPFSDGARACIGRRFAQTELCAVLARLMKDCSVELATVGDTEQDWIHARNEAASKLSRDVGMTLALELKADVPLNFVARGQERW
jgi:cytochrome P450